MSLELHYAELQVSHSKLSPGTRRGHLHGVRFAQGRWVIIGVQALVKKTEGPGEMLFAVQDEYRGFGFPMTTKELARVNEFRGRLSRRPLMGSPGLQSLGHERNRVGNWDFNKFED